jgi:DNA mismatch repair protein MutS2
MNVAAEFDWDRLVPTFRLIPDVPGSSLGIDIAGRFGIPGSLIESARTLVDTGKAALNSMVVELEEELGKVRKEREELESTASKARREREEQQQKLDQLQRARLAELEALKEAQIEEMETLKQVAHEALRAGPTPALPSLIQDQIRRTQAELVAAQPPPPAGLAAGDWVKVLHMKDPGMILEIRPDKKKAVVLVNGIQVKTDLASLERTKAPAKAARAATSTGPTYRLQERDLPTELNLISLRTDEALEQLATYLDAVVARSYPEVRIVHGKGTGALRSAVEKYLKKCRFIKGYRPGSYGEGESGVTIVTLK